MRKFNRHSRRALSFRLFFVLAGALLLIAALAPKANAQGVLIYFNFQDVTPPLPQPFDPESDEQVAFGGDNPGGGVQHQTLETSLVFTGAVEGTTINRTALDIDNQNPPNGWAMGMRTTPQDNGGWIQFHVDASAFSNMTLSFAINTAGNGFNMFQLSYSTNGGGTFTNVGGPTFIPTGGGFNVFAVAVPNQVNFQSNAILRLTFTGGTSSGNNLQTIIDNIQLTGVPEPTTVAGGLLGVLGLCWHQRRRLIRSVRFRRT